MPRKKKSEELEEDKTIEESKVDKESVASKSEDDTREEKPKKRKTRRKKSEDIPVAHTREEASSLESGVAVQTTKKFIEGRWHYLHRGKVFTGPKTVVAALRGADLLR